jgi:hypothetical protein
MNLWNCGPGFRLAWSSSALCFRGNLTAVLVVIAGG